MIPDPPAPIQGPDDLTRPLPSTAGTKVLLGCVLVPVLFFFVTGVLGVLLCGLFAVLGDRGPWKGMHPVVQVGMVASAVLMTLFFARVSRGLIAGMRGKEVPHLLPPWLTHALALVLGVTFVLTGLGTLVAGAGAGHGIGTSIGMGVVFLAYAVNAIRARRRRAEASPGPSP